MDNLVFVKFIHIQFFINNLHRIILHYGRTWHGVCFIESRPTGDRYRSRPRKEAGKSPKDGQERKTKMKKSIAIVISALAVAGLPGIADAAEASVGVDVASAYVFRGGTLNDGFVAQPYLEVDGIPGLTLGVWANYDIEDGLEDSNGVAGVEGGNFSEIDLYASYALPIEAVDASVGYCEYTYPFGGGEADREFSLSLGLDVPLSPSIGVYYGVDGAIEDSLYVEAGAGYGFDLSDGVSLSVDVAAGYVDPDEGESGFSHAQGTAGLAFALGESGELSAGVTYIAELDDEVLVVDEEFVGTIGVSYSY